MKKVLRYEYAVAMSVNSMYFGGLKFQRTRVLTPEARNLRSKIIYDTKQQILGDVFDRGDKLRVEIYFFDNWHNLDGGIKRRDIDNRLKFLIDSVFLGYEIDDSQIFELVAYKRQVANDEHPATVVIMEKID